MARTDVGPSHEPGRTQAAEPVAPEEGRTPPARPAEGGTENERSDEIAETVPERTTRATDLPHGTSFESPEDIERRSRGPKR
jgi:hypothetical protein